MSDPQIRLKRSTVAGKIPTTAQLALGELAVNAFDGEVFLKQDTAGVGIATRVIRVGAGGSLGKTIFVCKEGNDANTGLNEKDAKLTIKAASEVAEIFDTIKVYPGVYVENNPILLEKNVSVEGLELRNCIVSPGNTDKDLFHVNDGCHLTDLGFTGQMQAGAAAVAFRPLESVASDRYFDAARLIRVNSDFIAREAVGFLTSGYSGYAGGHLEQDGATALEANLDFIAQEAVGFITSTDYKNPAFAVTGESGPMEAQNCRDDVKDVLKSVAYDLKSTGNLQSVGAALSYFTAGGALDHVNGTDINGYSIAEATVVAIDRAVGIATYVINQRPWASVGAGGTTNITGFVYDNLTGIATVTSVGHGVTTGDIVELADIEFTCPGGSGVTTSFFPDGTNGEYFTVTEFVDANTFKTNVAISSISHTYSSGGTVEKYNNYYTDHTQVIDPTRRNKRILYDNVGNKVVVGTGWCVGVANSIGYLAGITTNAIGAGSSSGVVGIITGINLDTFRCSRDVRDILKAVCYDITRGGSTKSVAAGKTYFDESLAQLGISSFAAATLKNSPVDEVTQTIRAVDYAQGIVRCVINNTTWGGVSIGYTTPIQSIVYDANTGMSTVSTRYDHELSKDDGIEVAGLKFTCPAGSPGSEITVLSATSDNATGITTIETSTNHELKSGDGIKISSTTGNTYTNLIVDDKVSDTTFTTRVGSGQGSNASLTGTITLQRYYTPEVSINSATYDNITGLTTIGFTPSAAGSSDNDPAYIDNDGKIRLENLTFSCNLGNSVYPSGKFGFDFPVEKVGGDRYQDSANLIAGNKLEITDKALANIAIVHPDFFFPGDSSITTTSRYKDAYRLIQQNKGEIVGTAWTTMVTQYPGSSSTEVKCKRDLNYLVDAVSTDVFTGGNNYSIAFAKKYFDASGNFLSNGLDGEEVQSILAFDTARDQMKLAIANQLSTKDTTVSGGSSYFGDGSPAIGNSETYSCSDVQASIDNLVGIATEAVDSENLNVINGLTINYGNFPAGEFKCRRDIAYVVDAVIDDLRTDSNKNIRETTRKYFDASGNPISGGLIGEESESVTAFSSIAAYSKLAINNVLNYRDTTITADPAVGFNTDPLGCADIRSSIDSLIGIVTTHVGAGNLDNFPTLSIASSITVNTGPAPQAHTYVSGGSAFIGITTTVFPDGTFGNIFNVDSIVNSNTFVTNFGPSDISHTHTSGTGNILKFQPFTKNSDYAGGQIKDESIQYDPRVMTNTSPAGCKNVQSAIDTVIGIVTSIVGGGITAIQSPVNPTGITTRFEGFNGVGYGPAEGEDSDPNFSPGCGQIFKGPYVRNCTNFIFDSIGLKIDGFAAEPGDEDEIGVQGSMSVDSYTQYNQRGIGVSITNGSYAQLVSIFTICCDEAIVTASGGQCDLTNSNSSFGRIGLISNGISDATTKSIYRQTGKVVNAASANDITLEVSGLGTQRPYDGQVYYIDKLYFSLNTINVTNGGSGYNTPNDAIVTIDAPTGPNGIGAQAIPTVENGAVTAITLINTGTQYETRTPNVSIAAPPAGGVQATAEVTKTDPLYYKVGSATFPRAGVSTITAVAGLNNDVGAGSTVYLSRQSLQITSSHSFEYVGAGNDIFTARPGVGGVTIQENEVVKEEGGEVIYTSTDQAGNFRIGDGVTINQATGTITGRTYLKSLFNNVTPFILALGD